MTAPYVKTLGKGPPLILLHGWGWHSAIWQPIIPILSQHFQLFLIDLPGFGKSPFLTKDYTIENISLALLRIVPEKSAWLGWSLGGLIASFVAMTYPERITHLMTVASSPKFVRESHWSGVESAVLEKFSKLLITNQKKTLRDFLELQLRGSPKKNVLFSQLEQEFLQDNPVRLSALLGGLVLLLTTDLRKQLQGIQCPQLHIFGGLDTIVPASITTKILDLAPQSICEVIPRTGHMPFLTHPDKFIELLNKFYY